MRIVERRYNNRQNTLQRFSHVRATLIALVAWAFPTPSRAEPPQFDKDIGSILRDHCIKCHGGEARKGGLDLRTVASMTRGGDTGPALVPGKSGESLLFEQVASKTMPPGKNAKLQGAQLAVLRAWIDAGARADTTASPTASTTTAFWAFQPPKRPRVPSVRNTLQVNNPIDRFLLARLEVSGMRFSPEATRIELVRRLYFDLWGLPPSPEQVDAYLADTRPDAWQRLIDSLLASPHYGERWGRHWLDLAGYADSEGILDADYERSAAWRYRDYCIRAFNVDTPYDRFLQLQIAGDEIIDYPTVYRTKKALTPEEVDALVATGYLRCASDTSRPDFKMIKNAPGYYYQTLEDTVKIVASSTMGLTLQCAKCHSHKYDPITQEEYYRVQAVFMSGYRPAQWVPQVERRLNESTAAQDAEAKAHNAKIDAQVAQLDAKARSVKTSFAARFASDGLAKLPEPIREDTRSALATDAAKRTEVQKYLAGKFAAILSPPEAKLPAILASTYPDYKKQSTEIASSIAALQSRKATFPEIRAFYDLPGQPKTPILKRGDYTQPGREVEPGVLQAIASPEPFAWSSPAKDAKTSGRRLAFAKWLTQPGHPLTSRVIVNRIWLIHFGEAIVSTPDDFGTKGAAPSHPELLDWLAREFVASGFSIKAMHRLILSSTAYRQTSRLDPSSPAHIRANEADPDVRLLWRQRIRRLEAEALRDAILAASGELNSRMLGPPVPFVARPDGEVVAPDDASGKRRSIYIKVRRSQPLTLLQSFDQPVMETNCTRRGISTIASQALNLLNSDALTKQANAFAERVESEAPHDPVQCAFRLALGRAPSVAIKRSLEDFLAAQSDRHARSPAGQKSESTAAKRRQARRAALADLCQMLLSSNEFAYID
jgi:mono/diheme cytochrome c family protein